MKPDDIILKALFLEGGKHILVCATVRKCVMVDYSVDDSSSDRVIMSGFDYVGDVFLIKNKSFFGITHS